MAINIIQKISEECSDFLHLANDQALVKTLKDDNTNFKKVKVRTKISKNNFITAFNDAFCNTHNNMLGRSIFCNGKHKESPDNFHAQVYVFPINGFKYLFNPNITFHEEYARIYEKLKDSMDRVSAEQLFKDMITYSYNERAVSFNEALFTSKEIIIYGVPYYYAVKVNKFSSYDDLLNILKYVR